MVSPAAASVVPIADVRFGGSVSGLGPNKGLEYEFSVNRAAAGARAQLGENIEAVVLLDAAESRDETSTGFVVRPRDARVTFPLIPSAQFTAQVGVQPPIFGNQSWFNDDVDGFYTVSDTFQSVSVLAGIHSVRALGVSATASFQEDRGAISAMVSNTGDYAATEDNNGKDSSVRLQYQVIDPVTVVLAGRYGPRIEDDSGSLRAADAAALIQTDTLDALVEGLIGSEDDGTTNQEQATFIGTNVAVGYSVPLPIDMLDTLRVAARLSYFDPSYQTTNADAWMRTGGGMLVRWSTIESTRLLSGIGYEVRIPMDATVPISHQALLETHVQF